MNLEEKGLYVAENLVTGDTYLVNVIGKLPMLSINNCIRLSDFINGEVKTDKSIIESISDNCEKYNWTQLKCKIDIKPTPKVASDTISKYKIFNKKHKEFIEKLINNDENSVIIEICKEENLPIETAKELLKQFKLSNMC